MSGYDFSEKEIKEGKEHMTMKDFWIVYSDGNHNCNLLQAILDKYYNQFPNTYTAEVLDHQNSSRITVKCNVCNGVQLSSYDPFSSHNNGKQHKKNLVERENARDVVGVDCPVFIPKRPEDIEHNFEKGTLEYELFNTNHGVIGYQFLYSEIVRRERFFTCQLCSKFYKGDYKRMTQSRTLRHMQSKRHQDNYLRTKFEISDSTLTDEDSRQAFIFDVVRSEGKLLHNIFTFNLTDPDEGSSSAEFLKDNFRSDSVGVDSETKDPKDPATADEFQEIIHAHLQHLIKNKGDNITEKLQNDTEALDLLITTSNVLAQKIVIFGQDYDPAFKDQAKKLLRRCENVKITNQ